MTDPSPRVPVTDGLARRVSALDPLDVEDMAVDAVLPEDFRRATTALTP